MLKKTLSMILESGNDYLVAVKGNQGKLYEHLQSIVQHCPAQQPTLSITEQHGRREHRQIQVFSAVGLEERHWPGVKTVVCVERQREEQGRCSTHTAYYISSVATTARAWMEMVRGHWSIENRLHWPKDVLLREDATSTREENALLNGSVFRSIAINLLRLNGFQSIAPALRQFANQVDEIFKLLQ